MTKTITFNELRKIKDSLPDGSTHRIADELGLSVETVRNYFGGQNFQDGKSCGIHIEPGPDGGLVADFSGSSRCCCTSCVRKSIYLYLNPRAIVSLDKRCFGFFCLYAPLL